MANNDNAPDVVPLTGLNFSSDYLLNVSIITSDGQATEIQNLILDFNMYEDLFSPCVTGDIVLPDAHDIFTSYALHGNEYLFITLDKPSLNQPIKKMFRIYKISDRNYHTQALQSYKIHFCSEELFLSTQTIVRKSYKGMAIDSMINDILNNILKVDPTKTKNGVFSKTGGNFNIIIPKMQPLEAAQWLTTRAYNDNQTIFFFFENRDGFNFTSYENLISKPSYKTYFRGPKITIEPTDNINSFNYISFVHDFDIMKTNRFGGFANSLYTFDPIGRLYVKHTLNKSSFSSSNFLNNYPMTNESVNRFNVSLSNAFDSMQKFYSTTDTDSSTNPLRPEKFLNQRAIKLAQLNNIKVVLNVPIDPLLRVGQVVSLNLPKMTPQEDGGLSVDQYKSGKYIISSVRHGISGDAATTTLELLSDSLNSQLPAAIPLSGGLQNVKLQ